MNLNSIRGHHFSALVDAHMESRLDSHLSDIRRWEKFEDWCSSNDVVPSQKNFEQWLEDEYGAYE